MLKPLSVLLAVALAASQVSAAEIEGAWSGTWTKAGDALPVLITFSRTGGKLIGSFESDALRVSGIPFNEVTASGDKVHIVLSGDASTTVFDGTLAADKITGSFAEGEVKGSFALVRTTPLPVPAVRDVSFANGDVKLAGELILPSSPGRRPAVLFLHGSGAEGRWASRFLAQKFVRAGFVAMIYDKRGAGASTGDWRTSGFEDLVADAAAAIKLMAAQPEVDPMRIGVFGHSQGGTIAPMLAEQVPSLSFVVASAASGLAPADVELYSIANAIGIPNLPAAERADAKRFVREIVAVAYVGKSRAELDAMAATYRGRSWYFDPPPQDNFYWSFSRRTAAFRPLDHWRKVRAPVLLLFGAGDQRVPPRESGELIIGALREGGNARVALKIFANADHAFRIVPRKSPDGWSKSAPGYAEAIVSWAQGSK